MAGRALPPLPPLSLPAPCNSHHHHQQPPRGAARHGHGATQQQKQVLSSVSSRLPCPAAAAHLTPPPFVGCRPPPHSRARTRGRRRWGRTCASRRRPRPTASPSSATGWTLYLSPSPPRSAAAACYSSLVSDCVRWCVQETSRALSDLEEGSNVQVRRPAPPCPANPSLSSAPARPRTNQLINLPLSLVVFFIVKIGIISASERRVLSSYQVGE